MGYVLRHQKHQKILENLKNSKTFHQNFLKKLYLKSYKFSAIYPKNFMYVINSPFSKEQPYLSAMRSKYEIKEKVKKRRGNSINEVRTLKKKVIILTYRVNLPKSRLYTRYIIIITTKQFLHNSKTQNIFLWKPKVTKMKFAHCSIPI